MAGSLDGMAPLLAVDAPSLLFRAFYALPDSIRDGEGHSVNALLGTANLLLFEIERFAPRATVLCFGEEAAHYRTEAYAPYHADRVDVPDALTWQWSRAADFFGAFGFEIAVAEGLEADDLLGSYATVEAEAGGEALLLTGDRDMFQCASDRVRVLYVKTGGSRGAEEMGPKEVIARYGVPPEAVPDFIALRGDPSDGLPGAKGIGEKTAADVLRRHGTLEAALDNAIREKPGVRKALLADPDLLLAFKDIATLRHVPVELPPDRPLDTEGAAAAARELGMNRLAERLERWPD
jgi:5'-3' exonuclease